MKIHALRSRFTLTLHVHVALPYKWNTGLNFNGGNAGHYPQSNLISRKCILRILSPILVIQYTDDTTLYTDCRSFKLSSSTKQTWVNQLFVNFYPSKRESRRFLTSPALRFTLLILGKMSRFLNMLDISMLCSNNCFWHDLFNSKRRTLGNGLT